MRESDLLARLYARLIEHRSADELVNARRIAQELAKEMPFVGLAESELVYLVARYAAHLGVPVELDSAGQTEDASGR